MNLFQCETCGPRPEYLCMDGVAIGMMVEKLKKEDNLILPASSPVVLDAPSYKERMFIKTKKNRKLLKTACEENKFSNFRFVNYNHDPGMEIISDLIEAVKNNN